MKSYFHIPAEWTVYRQGPGYFITYFGEIYYGSIVKCPGYEDRIFIVQPDKYSEIRNFKQDEHTLEKYQQLGREIFDLAVIKRAQLEEFGHEINDIGNSYTNNQQFKRAFIFGAGASAFCVFGKDALKKFRKSPLCPPTGYELFAAKYDPFIAQFPGAYLSTSITKSKGDDIEQCMEEEWRSFKSNYASQIACRHLNLQYYMQALCTASSKEVVEKYFRDNLYNLFLDKLEKFIAANPKQIVSLFNFNYDTVLDELVARRFRYPFKNMNDYIDWNKRKILLFKPHGSCNWGWKFRKDRINGYTQETIAQALYDQNIEPHDVYFHLLGDLNDMIAQNTWGYSLHNDAHRRGKYTINRNLIEHIPEKTDDVYFPALLLPYRDKDELLMPYGHINAMEVSLGEVEEMYLIGWKGSEDLFNRKIEQHAHKLKRIIIVNPEADVVKKNLEKYIKGKDITIETVTTFEDFVFNHMDKYLGAKV